MRRLPAVIAGALLCAGCVSGFMQDGNSFSSFVRMPSAQWLYSSECVFTPDSLADSTAQGTLMLSLRHTASYPYSNIWIELACGDPSDSADFRRDTFDIVMADTFGRWCGSGMGTSFRLTDTLVRDFTLVRNRPLTVRHIMRADTIDGIEQVGIVFVPATDSMK